MGYPLFGGEDEHEQMCFIIEVLGMPPKDMMFVLFGISQIECQKMACIF